MFDAVFAVALAIPIIGMLIALTVLLSSWRWVLGFVLIAGAALLLVRMSYGLFPNPALARTVWCTAPSWQHSPTVGGSSGICRVAPPLKLRQANRTA